jgi:hypothetical protein
MRTVQLPPGDNPIAVNKYIISYIFFLNLFLDTPTKHLFTTTYLC